MVIYKCDGENHIFQTFYIRRHDKIGQKLKNLEVDSFGKLQSVIYDFSTGYTLTNVAKYENNVEYITYCDTQGQEFTLKKFSAVADRNLKLRKTACPIYKESIENVANFETSKVDISKKYAVTVKSKIPEQTTPPFTAENGSYYGEISKETGNPKTIYVNGYFKKDGTYVRSHYRSGVDISKRDEVTIKSKIPDKTTPPSTTENGSYYGEISKETGNPKTVYVNGYLRKDGIEVIIEVKADNKLSLFAYLNIN